MIKEIAGEAVKVNVWYSVDDLVKPPLQAFCEAASVSCLLMVASGDIREFEYMVGYYDHDKNDFVVYQDGHNILKRYDFRVKHWMIVPTPSNKII